MFIMFMYDVLIIKKNKIILVINLVFYMYVRMIWMINIKSFYTYIDQTDI
jgi:hypothetical protein